MRPGPRVPAQTHGHPPPSALVGPTQGLTAQRHPAPRCPPTAPPVMARRISRAASSRISMEACSLYHAAWGVQMRLGASFSGPWLKLGSTGRGHDSPIHRPRCPDPGTPPQPGACLQWGRGLHWCCRTEKHGGAWGPRHAGHLDSCPLSFSSVRPAWPREDEAELQPAWHSQHVRAAPQPLLTRTLACPSSLWPSLYRSSVSSPGNPNIPCKAHAGHGPCPGRPGRWCQRLGEHGRHLKGSDSCTSSAAPRIRPSFSACARAFSSTSPPRAVFTRKAPCLIWKTRHVEVRTCLVLQTSTAPMNPASAARCTEHYGQRWAPMDTS